jgi:hypothetical protein
MTVKRRASAIIIAKLVAPFASARHDTNQSRAMTYSNVDMCGAGR